MSAKENRPGVGTGTVEDLAGGLITGNSTTYPLKITLSEAAENYIEQLATDLAVGRVELWQLSPALLQFHTFAWESGRALSHEEIGRLNYECDRLYMAAFNPPARHDPNRLTFAALERIRGNPERADQIEADLQELLGGDRR